MAPTLAPGETGDARRGRKSLALLPYDILLSITQHFDMQDVIALQSVSTILLIFREPLLDAFLDVQIIVRL